MAAENLSPADMAACLAPGRVGWGHVRRLDEALAAGVEGADAWRKRGIEVLAEHGEDGDVTKRSRLARRQPPPQRRLLDEAELARDAEARLVARLDADLDPDSQTSNPARVSAAADSVAIPCLVALPRIQ